MYGNDIPIAVAGIVAKIYIIFIAIIIGLIQGAQPIFGYNYGAKKVRKSSYYNEIYHEVCNDYLNYILLNL